MATIANGATEITGFVPDDPTRKRLAGTPGTDASNLALARGEPAGFAAAIEFGLSVLARMTEGRFELRDGAITLAGRTKSGSDYAAIEAMAPPRGLDLAMGASARRWLIPLSGPPKRTKKVASASRGSCQENWSAPG